MLRRSIITLLLTLFSASLPSFAADAPIKIKMMALWQAGTMPYKVFEQFAEDVKKKVTGA